MKSDNLRTKSQTNTSLQETRGLLIEFLAAHSVRREMCLPILLMVGQNEDSMLKMMVFMRDNNPTEHEIIQMAEDLSEN